jgi:hypothetical protein
MSKSKSEIANIIGCVLIGIMFVVLMNPGYIFFAK